MNATFSNDQSKCVSLYLVAARTHPVLMPNATSIRPRTTTVNPVTLPISSPNGGDNCKKLRFFSMFEMLRTSRMSCVDVYGPRLIATVWLGLVW